MTTDYFEYGDGQIGQGSIACEVVGSTVKVGDVVCVTASVTGGMPKVAPCVDAGLPLGVVIALGEGQSGAVGKKVTVGLCGSGKIVKCFAHDAIAAGTKVLTAASARVKAGTGGVATDVGIALHTSTTQGDEIGVVLS
jgi:hypothetical protein